MINKGLVSDEIIVKQGEICPIEFNQDNDQLGKTDLLNIINLNAEQMVHYLEEAIMSNPFIEIEYSIEQTLPAFQRFEENQNTKLEATQHQSLEGYLFEQILLYRRTDIRDAMVEMVSFIDERGYLPFTYQEMADKLGYDPILTLDAMTLLKQLEPAGIAAYDLRECLMLQTERDNKAPHIAYYLLEEYYQQLLNQNYERILAETQFTEEEIKAASAYFQTLIMEPASIFDSQNRTNIIPDISVNEKEGDVRLKYNRQFYPFIEFNETYYNEMKQTDDEELVQYLPLQLSNYQYIENLLVQRERLLMRVVYLLVQNQMPYFIGYQHQPESLTIEQLAKESELSTNLVFRLLSNKTIEFDGQIYPLISFINQAASPGRDGFSANKVKDLINKLLVRFGSDMATEAIVDALAEENIIISSQIVESYRQGLLHE